MRTDPRAAIQATLDILLAQTDEAAARANAAVDGALKRRNVVAAREALNAVHECAEFRERVLYVTRGWKAVHLPAGESTASKAVRTQKPDVRPSTIRSGFAKAR